MYSYSDLNAELLCCFAGDPILVKIAINTQLSTIHELFPRTVGSYHTFGKWRAN